MKILTLISVSILTAPSFAIDLGDDARKEEVSFLCQAVDQQMIEWSTDMALEIDSCYSSTAKVAYFSKGLKIVSGRLTFNAPDRMKFQLDCQAAYKGELEDNISFGIRCH
jgi:hypothetical protein